MIRNSANFFGKAIEKGVKMGKTRVFSNCTMFAILTDDNEVILPFEP